jgi:predicted nucleic acid-binding protein
LKVATLVDTNVLIDIAVRDPAWLKWSRSQLENARRRGGIIINQIIFAEFSIRYETLGQVEDVLPEDEFRREGLPFEAAFAAARAFSHYRKRGGSRERVLPDFMIGAHAAIRGYPILTRDPAPYRTYFPGVALITPDLS